GVIWKATAGALRFHPEDGVEVVATGKLTTFPGRSRYQIVIDRLELAGQGALMALLDKRRRALAAEGLFDEDRKKRLPFHPRVIGVVTSPTGAVIRDILHRLADRCPSHALVCPVAAQGEGDAGPVGGHLRGQLREIGFRIERCARRSAERSREQLDACMRHWPEKEELLAPQRQRLDELAERLPRALRTELSHARAALGQTAGALRP